MTKEWREYAHQRVKEITEGICASMGATCDVLIEKKNIPPINSPFI
jgi:metal-dependent amidase/aminoacylase/carboxypeptidase family protein